MRQRGLKPPTRRDRPWARAFGGLYAIHRLRKLGLMVRAYGRQRRRRHVVLEPLSRCRCDSKAWSFLFVSRSSCSRKWASGPRRYGTRPKILRYIDPTVRRPLRSQARCSLNTRMPIALFDSRPTRGRSRRTRARASQAPYCIMATGNLSTPRTPGTPG